MESKRRTVIGVSTVLLLVLVLGVAYLVRLSKDASAGGAATSPSVVGTATPTDVPGAPGDKGGTGLPGGTGGTGVPGAPGGTGVPGAPGSAGGTGVPGVPGGAGNSNNGPTRSPTTQYDPPRQGGNDDSEEPPRPPVEISVSGVRLDGTVRDDRCKSFANMDFSVEVRVVKIEFVTTTPPDNGLVHDPGCRSHPSYSDGSWRSFNCLTRLPWLKTEEEKKNKYSLGCRVGAIRGPTSPGGDIYANVLMRLVATCTSRLGEPCRQLGDHADPSPDNPIEVTWTEDHGPSRPIDPH